MADKLPTARRSATGYGRFHSLLTRLAVLRSAVAWGRQEPLAMLAIIIVAGGSWVFVELADEIGEDSTRAIDRRIILALRTPSDPTDPIGPQWFEEMMRDYTAMGGVGLLVSLTVVVAVYLFLHRRPALAWLAIVAVLGGLAISLALKAGFDRPRPDLVPHGSYVYTRSFPSGHAMMAAITYLVLGVMLARTQAGRWPRIYILSLAVLLTVVVGISRVYLGVHWPTDVLGGWAAGAVWALVCWLAALFIERRGRARRLRRASGEEASPEAMQPPGGG